MRKSDVSTFVRIQVRAYFITLDTGADHLAAWFQAAKIEGRLAERRIRDASRRAHKRHLAEVAALPQATLQVHADGTSTRLPIIH